LACPSDFSFGAGLFLSKPPFDRNNEELTEQKWKAIKKDSFHIKPWESEKALTSIWKSLLILKAPRQKMRQEKAAKLQRGVVE
jgi:hypothetical protein